MTEKKASNKQNETIVAEEITDNKLALKESRYQTVRAISETRESFKKKVDAYNITYVKKPVEAGREFVKGLQKDPLKKIDSIIEDSTKAVKTLKTDSRKKFEDIKTKSKEISEKLKDSPFEYMGEVLKDAKADTQKKIERYKETQKKIVEGVEKDVSIFRDDLWDAGKKAIEKMLMRKSVEKTFNSTIDRFPSMLNLPSKKEVEELIKGIDHVSKKVDSLSKQASVA